MRRKRLLANDISTSSPVRRFNPLEVLRPAGSAGHKRYASVLIDDDIASARPQSDATQPAVGDLEPHRGIRSHAPIADCQSGRRVKGRQPDRSAIGNGPHQAAGMRLIDVHAVEIGKTALGAGRVVVEQSIANALEGEGLVEEHDLARSQMRVPLIFTRTR